MCAGGNLVDPMSWANRVENPCPDKPARSGKKYIIVIKTKTQPSTSLLTEARVAVAAPARNKVSAASEGIWEERKPGRRGEEVSHSDTPQLMLCACGWSLTGHRSGLYHYQQGSTVLPVLLLSRSTARKTLQVIALLYYV